MKDSIGYLEIQITDSCNLNCKGCSHCAGLVPAGRHIPLEHFRRDVRRLSELVPKIRQIRLLGGEPFLNPDLAEYLEPVRSCYPETEIHIVTNGLLCLNAKKEIYEKMRRFGVAMDVSVYPPTLRIREKLEKRFRAERIAYTFTPPIERFAKRIRLRGDSDAGESYQSCDSSKCHFLRDGVLCLCPAPVILDFLAGSFGLSFDNEEGKLDIYREDLTAERVMEFLNSPGSVCRYCTELEYFDWEIQSAAQAGDWIVG